MADHDRIWLSPRCEVCAGEDRQWCSDNVWTGGCDPADCTLMPIEYVRADLVTTPAEVDALRARVDELEGALREIDQKNTVNNQSWGPYADIARDALKGAKP